MSFACREGWWVPDSQWVRGIGLGGETRGETHVLLVRVPACGCFSVAFGCLCTIDVLLLVAFRLFLLRLLLLSVALAFGCFVLLCYFREFIAPPFSS